MVTNFSYQIVFLFLFQNVFCQNITIKHIGNSDEIIHLSYNFQEFNNDFVVLNKKNKSLLFKADKGQIISSNDVTRQTKIYAEPNDTIQFFLDKKGLINYSSKSNPYRKTESDYINQSFIMYGATEDFVYKKMSRIYAKQYNLSEYADETYAKEKQFLEDSFSKNLLSKSFYEYFTSIYWSLTRINELQNKTINEETFTVIEESFITAKDLITIYEYRILLIEYLKAMKKKQSINNNLFSDLSFVGIKFTSQDVKDYLLYYTLKSFIGQNSIDKIDRKSIILFQENCKNKLFLDEIEQDLHPVLDAEVLTEVINKNKGKLIFIDFWASWCMPCRQEFVYEKELMIKYPNVSFIFISIDKSISSWKKASKEYPDILNSQNSFMSDKLSIDNVLKKNKITTIPRYVLIGKNGEIINFNAPRPSSLEINNLINDNL